LRTDATAHAYTPGAPAPAQARVLRELWAAALRQGAGLGFSDTKLSALLGLVAAAHGAAVSGRLLQECSFRGFVHDLLRHGAQRWVRQARTGGCVRARMRPTLR
jgi:hypothetical protein